MDKNVFVTLVEPDGHEFTFRHDELMAFHKRTQLRHDSETGKNKYVTVTVLYFKNKAEFMLDVSPETVMDALKAPEKIEEDQLTRLERKEKMITNSEPEVSATSDEEFEARLKAINDQVAWELETESLASHNWEWGNPFGSSTYLP